MQSAKIVVLADMVTVVKHAILVNIASLLWTIPRNVLGAVWESISLTLDKQAASCALRVNTKMKTERQPVFVAQLILPLQRLVV